MSFSVPLYNAREVTHTIHLGPISECESELPIIVSANLLANHQDPGSMTDSPAYTWQSAVVL